ncbi:MAG: polyketide synthase dehydratase domain-containing protein, partial [Caulobacterales bacterium]|nr:polyketide synthase dehydratase domain-containing protein [Caulobacterales bacterium]
NDGQSTYAMANETLARVGWSLARDRLGCAVKVFDWGPWDGGMVGPELRAFFTARGVPLLAPAAGARVFADAVDRGPIGEVELVVGAGLAPEPASVRADVTLPAGDPLLADHRVEGAPVLPAMQALDWFTRMARAVRPHEPLAAIEDMAVLSGVALSAGEGALRARLEAAPLDGDPSAMELTLATLDGRVRYRARARFGPLAMTFAPEHAAGEPWAMSPAQAYDGALFHGPSFQVLDSFSAAGEEGAECWLRPRGGSPGALDVSLLDGGLQAAFLWGMDRLGGGSLPTRITRAVLHPPGPAGDRVRCVLRSAVTGSARATHDIAFWSSDGGLLALLEGVEMCAAPALAAPGR